MSSHAPEHAGDNVPRIAVVGGGITGLAAAHRLAKIAPTADLRLFEASERLGGPLHTLRTADSILEQGADSFLIKTPWALDLCRELGLAEELVPVNEHHRRALVVRDGRLLPVPEGFVLMRPQQLAAVLRSPVLSLRGKLRIMAEPMVGSPAGLAEADYDESVASFATRRLGREAFDRLVQPLVAGIFVADASRLSLGATFPEFLQAEREHGSLFNSVRASRRQAKVDEASDDKPLAGARYGQFVSLRGGLRTLVDRLVDKLPTETLRTSAPVTSLTQLSDGRWEIALDAHATTEQFDGVVLAVSTQRAAALLQPVNAELASELGHIEYASSAVVTLVYPRSSIAHALDGFGAVVPAVENRPILALSFLHVKFPTWAPEDRAVIRVFMGGVLRPELVNYGDDELIGVAKSESAALIGAHGEPLESHIARWRNSMPQYHVGHLNRVATIERLAATLGGVQLAGSGYRGVGIPQCIQQGRGAAERLAAQLSANSALRTERKY